MAHTQTLGLDWRQPSWAAFGLWSGRASQKLCPIVDIDHYSTRMLMPTLYSCIPCVQFWNCAAMQCTVMPLRILNELFVCDVCLEALCTFVCVVTLNWIPVSVCHFSLHSRPATTFASSFSFSSLPGRLKNSRGIDWRVQHLICQPSFTDWPLECLTGVQYAHICPHTLG